MTTKVKIKLAGKDAKHFMATGALPGPSGANFISRDELHNPKVSAGKRRGGERVPYVQGESLPGETGQLAPEYVNVSAAPMGFGPSYIGEGFDEVKLIDRDAPGHLNPVERCRQRNNRARDARTNLGRGHPTVPEVGDGVVTDRP